VWLIIDILLVVDLFIWLFTLIPYTAQPGSFQWMTPWATWIAAVLLALLVVGR